MGVASCIGEIHRGGGEMLTQERGKAESRSIEVAIEVVDDKT